MTPALLREFSRGLACSNEWRPHVEYLERLAEVYPPLQTAAKELRSKLEFLQTLCETGQGIAEAMREGK